MNDWSIQEIAKLAGTTSRTLRHYDDIGLLTPSDIGTNGYRRYDTAALVRLQRILLLRELGLSLPQIAEILARPASEEDALAHHLAWLHAEQHRLGRQIAAVQTTITALKKGEEPMAKDMFDGFDHTQYQDEVTQKWGAQAYVASDRWWRGMDAEAQGDWKARTAALNAAWQDAAARGADPQGQEAQALAARHVDWLRGIPGTPAAGVASDGDIAGYVRGLGEMYVADERFAANYGGAAGAAFVRDALAAYAAAHL